MERISDIRKKEIIDTFYETIIENGIDNASFRKIAEKIGAHPKLISYYFKTKETLVLALLDRMVENHESTFLKRFEKITHPEKRLDAVLKTVMGEEWDMMIHENVYYDLLAKATRNTAIRMKMVEMYRRYSSFLIDEITRAITHKVIPETDPARIATLIISLLEGASIYQTILTDAPVDAPFGLAELKKIIKAIGPQG